MSIYTDDENKLINSLYKENNDKDMNLVNNIINKMLLNNDYEELLHFLNNLFDFANIYINIVDRLIKDDNKECISIFLENEDILYFLTNDDKKKLKDYLNINEINIKLSETYDYYYNMLFNQGIRLWNSKAKDDNIIEHKYTRYNKPIKIKLKEVKDSGLFVSCVIYTNYKLSDDEQVLKVIDYINEYGFNIDKNIDKLIIIKNL